MRDVFEVMKESHTIHHFKAREIPESDIAKILEAACWAPSAGNLQPWFLYVVKNEELKENIEKACYNQHQISSAPLLVVVVADTQKSAEKFGERGEKLYCIQDSAVAAQNILLAAEALGLGACWVGAFDEQKVGKLLNIPPKQRAMAIICLGYSDEDVQLPKNRLQPSQVAKILH